MIIYGWGYFNRRDHSVVRTTCAGCGARGHLPSYTASKFFTLYFIPLIPLGTQKILCECSHCKQVRVLSLRKWNKLRQAELPATVTAYEASPANEEAAKNVLGTAIGFQDRATLRRVGPQIRTAFARDAKMLTFLAGAYDHLCLDKESDEAYLAAMSLSDAAEIAAEASAHMELQKLPRPKPPNRLLQSLPVLIVPGALLFFLTMFVQRAATSQIEDAHLLSGLGRAYTATINGTRVSLAPYQRVPARMLVYGKNEIEPTAESPFIEAGTFEINAPWYARPFGGPLVVVNPDQAAVMLWERSGYSAGTVPDSAYQYRLASGRTVHTYHDIDFAFRDFPKSITTSSGSGLTYKYRVAAFSEHEPQRVISLLLGNQLTDDLQRYVRAQLRATDDDATLIFSGARLLPRAEFIGLAEARLAARPVLIQWHRAYQTTVEGKPEGRELVARYRALAQQEPESSVMQYLLSRVLADPDECIAALRRAAALPNPTGYAAFGLGYRHMIDGDFPAALAAIEEALRLDPKNSQFQSMRTSALYGSGKYSVVEIEAGDLFKAPEADLAAFYEHLYRLAKLGQASSAKDEIPKFITKLAWSPERAPKAAAYLESALALAARDHVGFVAAAARVGDSPWPLHRAVIAGELDEALRVAQATPDDVGFLEHLVLYVLLQRTARVAEAEAQLGRVIDRLRDGGVDQQQWAAWLRGEDAPEPRLAAHTCDDVDGHFVYLCALAQRFPARATEYLARAAAMRYRETFYSLALDDVLPR